MQSTFIAMEPTLVQVTKAIYSVHKKNRDSQNVVILVPKISIKVTPRPLNIELPYSNIILSHFLRSLL